MSRLAAFFASFCRMRVGGAGSLKLYKDVLNLETKAIYA